MKPTYITEKSFRYRNGGTEGNRRVLVTAQNQNSLRGFDITDMPESKVSAIRDAWAKIQKRNYPLTKKESKVLNSVPFAKANFRSYKTNKIRYFHNS
jgi:hypothetical protein